jgi:hypothetical protein
MRLPVLRPVVVPQVQLPVHPVVPVRPDHLARPADPVRRQVLPLVRPVVPPVLHPVRPDVHRQVRQLGFFHSLARCKP